MRTLHLLIASVCSLAYSASAVVALEVSVTQLDGAVLTGNLKHWSEKHVSIVTDEGERQLPTRDLLALRAKSAGEKHSPNEPAAQQVELTDGTMLPIEHFSSGGGKVNLALTGGLADQGKEVSLDRRQIAAVRLQPLEAAARAQWDEIRAMKPAGDLLVVLKRDGKSLDFVEGVLGDVTAEKIEFELEGEPVRIDRSKVAGFVYYQRESERREPLSIVHAPGGVVVSVQLPRLAENLLHMTTVAGVELALPLEELAWIDFSAGKLLYLSDLEPVSEQWMPIVGLPSGAGLASAYGSPRRDRSAYGGPLAVAAVEGAMASSPGNTREFAKGLALRSRTELVYRLPEGFRRFTATAGIDPATRASGHVRLQIHGDDRPLLEVDIAGQEPPHNIDLDIARVKRFKIVVDFGDNLDTGDWLNVCDARIVK